MRKYLQIFLVVFSAGFILYAFFFFVRKLTEAPASPSEEELSEQRENGSVSTGELSDLDLEAFNGFDKSHFGFMHPNKVYSFAKDLEVHWERNPFAPFVWGDVEKSKGSYNWEETDNYVKKAQSYEIALVATIWPYADWDQETCHEKLESHLHPNRPDLGEYKQKPCDMESYKNFVRALVERYDGDGEDDLEGLKYPIRYWEVMNEVEEGEDVQFLNFRGEDQSRDYLDILVATAQAVNTSDSQAKVLNGGIAGLAQKEWDFWEEIFKGVGRDYIDIINIHAVNSPDHLQMVPIKSFMLENLLTNPVWITEVQFASSQMQSYKRPEFKLTGSIVGGVSAREVLSITSSEEKTEEEWSEYLVKVYVQAFEQDASRLFYVGLNNTRTTQNSAQLVYCDDEEANLVDNFIELDTTKCRKQKMFDAFDTLVSKIDYFEDVEKLAEGQYKFTLRRKVIYVLWGNEDLHREIKGDIRITDIFGERVDTQADSLTLSSEPVYVELL
jgi:hypothetical protein